MDGENNGPTLICQALQNFDDGERGKRVKTRGRFVQQENTRVSQDLYCDRDTPLLTATDAFDHVTSDEGICAILQPKLEEHRLGLFDFLFVAQEWWEAKTRCKM